MDITLLALVGMVLTATAIAFWQGRWPLLYSGLKQAVLTLKFIWVRLILGITLGGLIQVIIPSNLVAEWLGPTSGLKGILIGSYVGAVISGGPYITLPIVVSIYAAGAGVGPVIALLTSISLLGIQPILAWQIPLLGAKITLVKYAVCLVLPPFIGLAGDAIYRLLTAA
ncbi:MAG: permease [Dehalococcoidales bacterium]|nr:permease [Dehalococcoidales bacterium]